MRENFIVPVELIFTNKRYFYAFTTSMMLIPISYATVIPFCLLAIPLNFLFIKRIELLKSSVLRFIILVILIPLNFLMLFPILYFFKAEGNVFAFALAYSAVPVIILNLVALFRLWLEYFSNEKDSKYIEVEDRLREVTIDNKNNTYKITIDDRTTCTFLNLKDKLYEQYSKLGFNKVKIDKSDSWMIKKSYAEDSYVYLSHQGNDYIIEVYNAEKPNIDL